VFLSCLTPSWAEADDSWRLLAVFRLTGSDEDTHFNRDVHARAARDISTKTSSSLLRLRSKMRKPWSDLGGLFSAKGTVL
jgi:hypothetical protein